MIPNEITKNGKDYVGYEYKTVSAPSDKVSIYLDAYENFGWIQDETAPTRQIVGMVTLKLKRDRKILNKTELTRLGQHFEACMDEIAAFERTKTRFAAICSISAGVIGTVFLAGSVFAVTNEPPLIALCIILGLPGLFGWALPHFLYKHFSEKRVATVGPLIEQKYDEIHEICEKGHALTH